MKAKVFIDTNFFIYALTESKEEKDRSKRNNAVILFENIIQSNLIVISAQVVNEFYFNLLRKFSFSDDEIMDIINENIVPITQIRPVTFQTCVKAHTLRNSYSLSFWDSIIVASASDSGCSILYSEDMHNGLLIENELKIINPFLKAYKGP